MNAISKRRLYLLSLLFFLVSGLALSMYFPVIGAWASATSGSPQPALLSSRISVLASKRGNPLINLGNGHEILASYASSDGLERELLENRARPLALASADFDEDGAPDLVCGYAGSGSGIVALYRGNGGSHFLNGVKVKKWHRDFLTEKIQRAAMMRRDSSSPFLSPALVFPAPEAPEFMGTGDFNADGHFDIVAAARGSNVLYLLPGDGLGNLGKTQRIELPGRITAFVTGETNRVDGLADVVVGIIGPKGSAALVFEGPEGAFQAKPEVIPLPAEATALALGQLDDGWLADLAVAAGDELMVVHGRDRKLSLDAISQSEVPEATITHLILTELSITSRIASLAVGNFVGDQRESLALLTEGGSAYLVMRGNPQHPGQSPVENVRVAPKGRGPDEWTSELLDQGLSPQAAVLVSARVSTLAEDDLLVADRGAGQLRILTAAAPASDASSLERTSASRLLAATGSRHTLASLDVESGPVAILPMRLNSDALSDLVVLTSGRSTPALVLTESVATYTVTNTDDSGDGSLRWAIERANSTPGADTIAFNFPGTPPFTIAPTSALPAITDPVSIDGFTQTGFTGWPLIELNGISAGNSANGLDITRGNCMVRGLAISGFGMRGISAFGYGDSIISDNIIGTDISGTYRQPNGWNPGPQPAPAVIVFGHENVVRYNLISGNIGRGLAIGGDSQNMVWFNFIGTDAYGLAALGNGGTGLEITTSLNNIVGNLISANGLFGIALNSPVPSQGANRVQSNFIGTDYSGTVALGNVNSGMSVTSSGNIIGGTAELARNIISGNGYFGISLNWSQNSEGNYNYVQGNFIGTDITGRSKLGNGTNSRGPFPGIGVATAGNAIGGAVPGAGNLISGNKGQGININGDKAPASIVQGNFIGTNSRGDTTIGNELEGVLLLHPPASLTPFSIWIGGTANGESNTIAHNGASGVAVVAGANYSAAIRGNSIFANTGLGIDLARDGLTANDLNDGDTGSNNLQNYPELTSAVSSPTGTLVQGALNSALYSTFQLDFYANSSYDPSGYGEGAIFLGTTSVVTNGNYNASFATALPPVATGHYITATATDASGNTSEFSHYIQVIAAPSGTEVGVPSGSVSLTFPTGSIPTITALKAVDPNQAGAVFGYSVYNDLAFEIAASQATGPIVVCFNVPTATDRAVFDSLKVFHRESGILVDRTIPQTDLNVYAPAPDFASKTICAAVPSLSPFIVAVPDNTPPVIGPVTASPNVLWPANHKMVDVTLSYAVTDNWSELSGISCSLSAVSNEPDNGLGDGDTPNDIQVVDAHHVRLRAERAGTGNGRVYTISVTCTDRAGNKSVKTVTVTVPKDQSKK